MLTAPMKLSSSLFGPRPRQQGDWYQSLRHYQLSSAVSLETSGAALAVAHPASKQNSMHVVCSSAKIIRGQVLIHSL